MTLREWQLAILPVLRSMDDNFAPVASNVTLLAYFYYDDERLNTEFFTIECSIRCAWHVCGRLPTVLVVNRVNDVIRNFAVENGVEIQCDPLLTGGVKAMNLDCDGNLYSRFSTDYVLTVESDGIIVNNGLENFVGKFDYVGAPWRKNPIPWYLAFFPDYRVGNSGLCLRSRRICFAAAKLYRRFFKWMPYNWLVIEDMFYCKILRWFFRSFRDDFQFADEFLAARFSLEEAPECLPSNGSPPLGFHGLVGFGNYVSMFGLPLAELLKSEVDG